MEKCIFHLMLTDIYSEQTSLVKRKYSAVKTILHKVLIKCSNSHIFFTDISPSISWTIRLQVTNEISNYRVYIFSFLIYNHYVLYLCSRVSVWKYQCTCIQHCQWFKSLKREADKLSNKLLPMLWIGWLSKHLRFNISRSWKRNAAYRTF